MLEERKRRTFAIILGCIWLVMLVVLSFLPSQDKLFLHTTGHFHLLGHLIAFATTTLLLVGGTTSLFYRFSLAAFVACFGFLLEFVEHVVYVNPLERTDVLVDTLGVILGFLIVLLWDEVRRARQFDERA